MKKRSKKSRRIYPKAPPGKKYIFRPWKTEPDGTRVHASQYGLKAFPILVDE